METPKRRVESEEVESNEPDEIWYWCTDCGMMFSRSCTDLTYSWCARCEATSVREMPWHVFGEAESTSREASVGHDTGPGAPGADDPQRRV